MGMQLGPQVAQGKTKIVYAHPSDPKLSILFFKDDITAGDGAKHDVLAGKGVYDWKTAANCFKLLNKAGISTHFVDAPEEGYLVVHKLKMIPLECVARRLATGSLVKRLPFKEGQRFEPPMFELFLKDDALHDPFINDNHAVALDVANANELRQIASTTVAVFKLLEAALAGQDIALVDLKIEFGRDLQGRLRVGDDVTNNSWRIWPGGKKAQMLDKQLYRDGKVPLDVVLEGFRKASEISAKFVA